MIKHFVHIFVIFVKGCSGLVQGSYCVGGKKGLSLEYSIGSPVTKMKSGMYVISWCQPL